MRLEPMAVTPQSFAALMEELRFRYHKWDAYVGGKLRVLPGVLLLTPGEHDDAIACAVGIHDALERAGERLRRDTVRMERLGIPHAVQEIIAAEIPHRFGIVRYDLIPTADGWMTPEVNEDAPGGFNESIASRELFSGLLYGAALPGDFAASFLGGLPEGRRVGMVYATGYAEDLQHLLVLADLLHGEGIQTVLASPEHLSCSRWGKPRLLGESVDWIFRFFPGEWYGYLHNIRAWQRAAARIPIVNPLARLVRQSKALFALWREESLLDPADTELLNRLTPYTECFRRDRADLYRDQKDTWVIKKIFGRMGDTVSLGRLCTTEAWDKILSEAAKAPGTYIAQHAFVPLPLAYNGGNLYPALGLYLVNGRFAGYYSRADEIGVTTHEAYYVVTALESA